MNWQGAEFIFDVGTYVTYCKVKNKAPLEKKKENDQRIGGEEETLRAQRRHRRVSTRGTRRIELRAP